MSDDIIDCTRQRARLSLAGCMGQWRRNAPGSPCRYCFVGAMLSAKPCRVKAEPEVEAGPEARTRRTPAGAPRRVPAATIAIGTRFGLWEVISKPFRREVEAHRYVHPYVECRCHGCGETSEVRVSQLRVKKNPTRGCKPCRLSAGVRKRRGQAA